MACAGTLARWCRSLFGLSLRELAEAGEPLLEADIERGALAALFDGLEPVPNQNRTRRISDGIAGQPQFGLAHDLDGAVAGLRREERGRARPEYSRRVEERAVD